MPAEEEDRVLRFLADFASMSEAERDEAIDSLRPEDRDALIALAEAREAAAEADLIRVLDAGQGGLDRLRQAAEPAELYAAINLAARNAPNLVVEALFAAVVLYRGWDAEEALAFRALREQWHWHVYEQIAAARAHRERERGEGA